VYKTDMALPALDSSGLRAVGYAGPQSKTALGVHVGTGLRAVPRLQQRSALVAHPIPASVSGVGFGSAAKVGVVVKPTNQPSNENYMNLTCVATGGGASGPPRRRGPA
jgi:hypothetical protein